MGARVAVDNAVRRGPFVEKAFLFDHALSSGRSGPGSLLPELMSKINNRFYKRAAPNGAVSSNLPFLPMKWQLSLANRGLFTPLFVF